MSTPERAPKAPRAKTRTEISAWDMLPDEVLAKLDSAMVDKIIDSIAHESRMVMAQTWAGLVLGFLSIPLLVAAAWHYADVGAPQYGAAIVTTGAASIVGLFLGVRKSVRKRINR